MWRTCTWAPLWVSPDGKHVLAARRDDSSQARELSVLDVATGAQRHLFTGHFITRAAREDDEHVLFLASERTSLATDEPEPVLVRCSLDGRCERAWPGPGSIYRGAFG